VHHSNNCQHLSASILTAQLLGIIAIALSTSEIKAAPITMNQFMNLAAMQEAADAATVFLKATESGGTDLEGIRWSGNLSDSQWSYSTSGGLLNGKPLSIAYTGSLNGSIGESIVVAYTGTGTWGTEPFRVGGTMTYFYDAVNGDYINSRFEQLHTLGTNSVNGWSTGLEWIGGATLGAIVTVATCGTAPVIVAIGGGLLGGLGGGELVASVSSRTQSFFDSDKGSDSGNARSVTA